MNLLSSVLMGLDSSDRAALVSIMVIAFSVALLMTMLQISKAIADVVEIIVDAKRKSAENAHMRKVLQATQQSLAGVLEDLNKYKAECEADRAADQQSPGASGA